jgi:phosphoribosylanthranilate isomerase
MTAIKICGVTRAEDGACAAELGATHVGLNFWPGSRRCVTVERAAAIAAALPAGVIKVGVFVDAPAEAIEDTVAAVGLDRVQLHGAEDPDFCRRFGARAIRAVRVAGPADLMALVRYDVELFLLDAAAPGAGRPFDWSLARAAHVHRRPFFLAGGLTPDNVADAVRAVAPFGVDVASGVESAPGIKDASRLRRFIAAVRGAR